jgi:phosphohistidine swiveling domain-containing protein
MTFSPLDTDPHPWFSHYSAQNFAEVAPERLSIMSWSLIGNGFERGTRALLRRLAPGATWATGSHYCFVGYFACRPYHNLSGYCQLARELPGVHMEDVTAAYFEAEPPPPTRSLRGSDPWSNGTRLYNMARAMAASRGELSELEGRVVILEQAADRALRSRPSDVPMVLDRARGVLERAWEMHVTATASLVPLRGLQRALGRRLAPRWDEIEPWLNRPEETVWDWVPTAADAGLPEAAFTAFPFYEVADGHEPWTRYAKAVTSDRAVPSDGEPTDDHAAAFWGMLPPVSRRLLQAPARLVTEMLAFREDTKVMAMRGLHVFRRLLPRMAELSGLGIDDWPYLTIEELCGSGRVPAEIVSGRREACAAALRIVMPTTLDLSDEGGDDQPGATGGRRIAPGRVEPRAARGRGVAPGRVTGTVVRGSAADAARVRRPRVLACESLDGGSISLLRAVDGVVAERGSVLSHVATLARELGIPAVLGHPLTAGLTQGQVVSIDGATGEISVELSD